MPAVVRMRLCGNDIDLTVCARDRARVRARMISFNYLDLIAPHLVQQHLRS